MLRPDFKILETTEALERFLSRWTALHEADINATPFQHPAWLLPWWHQFHSSELCAVAVFRGGVLRAFLPLYIYTEPATAERKLMLLGVGTSDYLDGVYAYDCGPEEIQEALCWLAGKCNWNTLSLLQLPRHSLLRKAAGDLGADGFESDPCSTLSACAVAQLPVKIRRNALYYGNAARRRGALELTVADASNCLERFDDLVHMHTTRWQAQGGSGVLADPRVLAWHREALPHLARAGLLRLYTLTLAGQPIGAMYALCDPPSRVHRTVYFYLPGFSTAHVDLRPGTLLMAAAIEHAASEGIAAIDLLRGDEAYKQHWHPTPVATFGCTLPQSGIANALTPQLEMVS